MFAEMTDVIVERALLCVELQCQPPRQNMNVCAPTDQSQPKLSHKLWKLELLTGQM